MVRLVARRAGTGKRQPGYDLAVVGRSLVEVNHGQKVCRNARLIACRLCRLKHAEAVRRFRDGEINRAIRRDLDENAVVGFAIVDVTDHNIWALFIQPEFEGQGIGRKLQVLMLDWYFLQTNETVWLGTAPNSRAENFYRKSGWTEVGRRPNGEIRFEMPYHTWQNR